MGTLAKYLEYYLKESEEPDNTCIKVVIGLRKKSRISRQFKTTKLRDEYEYLLKTEIERIQKTEMKNYFLIAIPVSNDIILHTLEPFVASHFKCKWNNFKTH